MSKTRKLLPFVKWTLRLSIYLAILVGLLKLYVIGLIAMGIVLMLGVQHFADNQEALCEEFALPDCINLMWSILQVSPYALLAAGGLGVYGIYHLSGVIDRKVLVRLLP